MEEGVFKKKSRTFEKNPIIFRNALKYFHLPRLPEQTNPTRTRKTIDIKNLRPLLPMTKRLQTPDKFKFITERTLKREKYEITRWQSAQLRSRLPKGVYWLQVQSGGSVVWNWTLLQSYLLNGADCPEHRLLVEEYITTLP